MTPQRQRQVLVVLLVVLVAVVARSVLNLSSGSSRGNRRARVSQPLVRPGSGQAESDIVELRLDDLEQKPGEFRPGRDPFRFKPKARPTPPPRPAPKPRPQPARKPPVQRPAQPARPRPPEPTFVFLGSFGPEEKRVAVFSDNTEIFNVVEGDVFKEAFVVHKIGYESADIGWVDFPDEPTRRLAAGG